MAKTLPEIKIKLTRKQLLHLLHFMKQVLTNKADLDTNYKENIDDKMLWAINVGIYREWCKKSDNQSDNVGIKMDVSQAMAFLIFWNPCDFGHCPNEQQLLRKIQHDCDHTLQSMRHSSLRFI